MTVDPVTAGIPDSSASSGEDLDTQYDDADSSAEDDESESAFSEETIAIEEAVAAAADAINAASTADLDEQMRVRVVTASITASANPGEAFTDPGSKSPRLAAITTRQNATLDDLALKGYNVGKAHTAFLEDVLGFTVPGGDVEERAKAATGQVTTLVQAFNNPATAAPGIATLAADFAAQSDEDYWLQLADDFDGTPTSTTGLKDHVVFMGLTIEMKPKGNFIWHNADQKAMFVDELIGASGSGGRSASDRSPIDVASIYRKAAQLTFNAQPVPRSVVAEIVRMAMTELIHGVQPGQAPLDSAPTHSALTNYLRAEITPSDATADEKQTIQARNGVRTSALSLAESAAKITVDTPSSPARGVRTAARDARGQLGPLLNLLMEDSRAATSALAGGSNLGDTLSRAFSASGLSEAVAGWDAVYRAGAADPVKLGTTLDDLTTRVKDLVSRLNAAVGTKMPNPAQASMLRSIQSLSALTAEVAAEAGELLEGHQNTSDPLKAPHALAESTTAQARSRAAAMASRDPTFAKAGPKAGLSDYLDDSLKAFSKKSWCANLKSSATKWSTAATHDYAAVSSATADVIVALNAASTEIDLMPASGVGSAERRTALAALDAIAYAIRDRLLSLASIDPQTAKLYQFDTLANATEPGTKKPTGLNKWLNPFPPPDDAAKFWSAQKATVKSPPTGGAFGDALTAWQQAAGTPRPNSTDLATKTYKVLALLWDYRRQVTASTQNSAADRNTLYGILDTIAMVVTAKTATS